MHSFKAALIAFLVTSCLNWPRHCMHDCMQIILCVNMKWYRLQCAAARVMSTVGVGPIDDAIDRRWWAGIVIYTVYKLRASGSRYYAWHWNCFWMHDHFLVSLSLLDLRSHVLCLYYGAAVLTTHFTRFMFVSGAQDLQIIRHHPQSSLLTLFMW